MAWEFGGYWRCTAASGGSPGCCSSLGAGGRHEALHIGHCHGWGGLWVTSARTQSGCSHLGQQDSLRHLAVAWALHCPEDWSSLFSHVQSINSKHPWKMEPCSSEHPLSMFAPTEAARRAALAAATHRRENPVFYPAEPSQPLWLMRAACCCAWQGQD